MPHDKVIYDNNNKKYNKFVKVNIDTLEEIC